MNYFLWAMDGNDRPGAEDASPRETVGGRRLRACSNRAASVTPTGHRPPSMPRRHHTRASSDTDVLYRRVRRVAVEVPVRVRTNPSRFARTCDASRRVPPTASAPAPSPPPRRDRPGTRRFSTRGVREGYGRVGSGHGVGLRRGPRVVSSRRRGRWRTRFSFSRSNARFLRRTFCVREGARMSVTSALASRTSFLPCEMEMRSGCAGKRASVIGKVRWRGRVPSGSGARAEDAPGGGR